jgi:hypothetical protein
VPLLSVLNCNNCTRYVEDQKVGFYVGLYTTKHGTENEQIFANSMRALTAFDVKKANQLRLEPDVEQSSFSLGLGRLLSAARAATNGETIGAPMAAYCARGNKIFEMSHTTVALPLEQAVSFLSGQKISASINKFGTVYATINDYVYRSSAVEIDNLNYWEYLSSHEMCRRDGFSVDKTSESFVTDGSGK